MYYRTRSQMTETDFRFIAQTLGTTPREQQAIYKLTSDPYSMTSLLHHRKLFEQSLTIPPILLSISPQLFFYVFIYQALERRDLENVDDLVDYVAGICVEFRSNENLWQMATTEGGKTIYVVDLLNLLGDLDEAQQYFLRRYIGNVTLFLTGFFPAFLYSRSQYKSAPPIQYYEKIGRSQFETAAEKSLTYDENATPVLTVLAERFVEVRSALNVYTDNYLHLHSKQGTLENIRRQAGTLDEQSFRESLDL